MSEKLKEFLDQFHSTGAFLPTKTIRVTGDVDEDMYNNLVVNLHAFDSVTGEITIKLMSDGGSVSIARAIYDLIRGCKNIVRVQCYGEVASAASIILQAADIRVMSPNSKLMIHSGSESMPAEHPRNIDRLYQQHRVDETWMESIYLVKIKEVKKRFTKNKLRAIMTWDTTLSPKQALELGLIDKIGELQ